MQNADSPFEFFKFSFSGVFICAIVLVFLFSVVRKKITQFKISTGLILILFVAVANLMSYVFSVNPYLSMWGDNLLPSDSLASVLIFSTMAFIASVNFSDQGRRTIAVVLLASLFLQVTYGFFQALGYDFFSWTYAKPVFGTLGSTVAFSTFIGSLLPLSVCAFFLSNRLHLKATLFFYILLANYVLLETGSRTPAVVNLFVQCFVIIYFVRKRSRFKPLSSSVALLAAVLCLYGLTFLKPAAKETLSYKFNPGQVAIGANDRVMLWKESLIAWKEHPFLGYGPEAFQVAQRAYQSVEMNQYERWHSSWVKAHNHLIQYLVSIGIIGVLMHLLLFGFVIRRVVKIWLAASQPTDEEIVALGFGSGFIFIFLANLTAFNFITLQFFYFLFPVFLEDTTGLSKRTADITKIKKVFPLLLFATAALFALLGVKFFNHFRADIFYQLSYKSLNESRNIQVASLLADEAIRANDEEPAYYCHKAQIETQMLLEAGPQVPAEVKGHILESHSQNTESCKDKAINRDHYFLQVANQYAQLFSGGAISTPEESLENYEILMTLAPNVPLAYYRSALVYRKAGNYTAFEENLDKALDLKSNYLPAYVELFQFYYERKRPQKKDQLLERFAKVNHAPTEFLNLCKILADIAVKNKDSHAEKIFLEKYFEYKGER